MIHSATEIVCEVGAMQAGSEGDGSDASINHNNDKQWMTGVATIWHICRVSSYNMSSCYLAHLHVV